MNLDNEKLTAAIRDTRGTQPHTRVIVALSAFTFSFWHQAFLDFQRADKRTEFLIDHRIKSGSIAVRLCPDDGTEGAERQYDLRADQVRRAGG